MKLLSITDNGSRVKDFIDIAFLSSYYSLDEMLDFYIRKIPNSNKVMPLKALTYFNDINFNESVAMMNGVFDWHKIAERLLQMTSNSDKKSDNFSLDN